MNVTLVMANSVVATSPTRIPRMTLPLDAAPCREAAHAALEPRSAPLGRHEGARIHHRRAALNLQCSRAVSRGVRAAGAHLPSTRANARLVSLSTDRLG